MDFNDIAQSRELVFRQPPKRVISLVPSQTESLFDLGFGGSVVGITDYCIHPIESLRKIPRLGGPKNARIGEILALSPDLVLANKEENTRSLIEGLQGTGVPVWVTFPKTVRAALDVLWALVGIFRDKAAATRLQTLEVAFEWARNAALSLKPIRYFCPIWYDQTDDGISWWMTFNRETYSHDLLSLAGGQNCFSDRYRRYPFLAELNEEESQDPGTKDTRYPRLGAEEIQSSNPDLIILPSEPFLFTKDHIQILTDQLGDVSAVRNGNIRLVDGSLITWHGTRLGRALQELPNLFTVDQ